MDLLKNAKDLAETLKSRASDARSKARSASQANMHVTHGESSFSAGAGAGADADAGRGADAETSAEAGPASQDQAPAQ
jgi:hypothetical protein